MDGLLYHETELRITEPYTDTGAFTDQRFGRCHLLGFRYAPRIRAKFFQVIARKEPRR